MLDRRGQHHRTAAELIAAIDAALRVPMLIVAEPAHLAGKRLGASVEIRISVGRAAGEAIAEPVHAAD